MNIITFDVETTSLDPLKAEVVGISYKEGDLPTIYTYDFELVRNKIEEADLVIGHNVKFDLAIMKYPKTKAIFDTLVAEWLLYPDQNRFGLKSLCMKYFNEKQTTYKELINKYKPKGVKIKDCTLDVVPLEEIEKYCIKDVDTTYAIYKILKSELEARGITDLYYSLEMSFLEVLMNMEREGVKVCLDPINELNTDLQTRIEELRKEFDELSGGGVNIDSPAQLSQLLFDRMNLPRTKRIKRGLFSTEAEDLEKLAVDNYICKVLLEYRKASKIKKTYLDALPKQISIDGRIHCSFNQAGTATGRISSDSPNLQNIPKKGDFGDVLRSSFVADPGYKLVSFDYNQMELRLLAGMSGDENMLRIYREGGDIHTMTACKLFGKEEVSDEERSAAKTVNFGIIYGQTAFGLSKSLNISEREARDFIYRYACTFPTAWFWRKDRIKEIEETLKTRTLLGRVRDLTNVKGNLATRAVNTPIQGTAGDLVKIAMIRVANKIKGSRVKMVLQVHDELVFEIPEEELDMWVPVIQATMESVNILNDIELLCPMVVEVSIGDTWKKVDKPPT